VWVTTIMETRNQRDMSLFARHACTPEPVWCASDSPFFLAGESASDIAVVERARQI